MIWGKSNYHSANADAGINSVRSIIFTQFDRGYEEGAGALLNSAVRAGYRGDFVFGYKDEPPYWLKNYRRKGDSCFEVAGCMLYIYKEDTERHLGFQKPFAAFDIFERFPGYEAIFYFDADCTLVGAWSFFEGWVQCGIGLVQDVNFPELCITHPWRVHWVKLLKGAGYPVSETASDKYPNGGYFCIKRQDRDFLLCWMAITLEFEKQGGDTRHYDMSNRWKAVVSDQDLMAAAVMAWKDPVCYVGPVGMGFTGYLFLIAHAIESPKPWKRSHLLHALQGTPPSPAARAYLQNTNGPVAVLSAIQRLIAHLDLAAGKLVGRVWKR